MKKIEDIADIIYNIGQMDASLKEHYHKPKIYSILKDYIDSSTQLAVSKAEKMMIEEIKKDIFWGESEAEKLIPLYKERNRRRNAYLDKKKKLLNIGKLK